MGIRHWSFVIRHSQYRQRRVAAKRVGHGIAFFLAYQQFTPKEDLKLQRELAKIEGMEIPKEVLQRNPLVRFGMNKGLRKGLGKGFRKGRQQEAARAGAAAADAAVGQNFCP